jgi:hypothetical protein
VVCDQSGWLSAEVCPVCGKPVRHTPDVIDELAAAVIDEGGTVRHVAPDAKLGDFQVAADIRFPLPPVP